MQPPNLGAFREVPFMGVIWVVHEASKLGFSNGHPDWCNLGQGQPEVGAMTGAPPRIGSVRILPEDHAYGPLGGLPELREAIAKHTNRLFRKGRKSLYTAANVCVAQGGRLALSRAFAALDKGRIGHQLPDYTAYEDLFNLHLGRLRSVAVRTRERDGFALTPQAFSKAVSQGKLRAFILSNPCNPTGVTIRGRDLAALVRTARDKRCTLLLDEFYSHFTYDGKGPVSAAAFVKDVEKDPVVLFDGLTKGYRYPGWRIGWALGPSPMVEAMARTASAMDGGPSRIAQRAALEALEPKRADRETAALRKVFGRKRDLMVARLSRMGIRFAAEPTSTFYAWGCLDGLPPGLRDSMAFFRAALDRKVLTVPGAFFDVNPGKRRKGASPYRKWMRFSFGPPEDNLRMGLDRLEAMVLALGR